MSRRSRRDAAYADRLLDMDVVDGTALARTLAAARAPARRGELAGLRAATAAFEEATSVNRRASTARARPVAHTATRRILITKAVAALGGASLVGGAAYAATSTTVFGSNTHHPRPGQHAPAPRTGGGAPATGAAGHSGGAKNVRSSAARPDDGAPGPRRHSAPDAAERSGKPSGSRSHPADRSSAPAHGRPTTHGRPTPAPSDTGSAPPRPKAGSAEEGTPARAVGVPERALR